MTIAPEIVTLLAVGGVSLGVVSLLAVLVLSLRLRAVSRRHRALFSTGERDVVGVLDEHASAIATLARGLDDERAASAQLRELLRGATSRVAVVRYDAFDDMGGALSFSAALLDERGHGVVISAINGRAETRCYAKPVLAGVSDHHVSDEEAEAIAAAIEERPAREPTLHTRRRRRAS